MISALLYYTFVSSAVLIYGIGLNRSTVISRSVTKELTARLFKCIFTVLSTTVVSWIITRQLLVPTGLTELYPLLALLLFIAFASFIEILIRITTGFITSEFAVAYLIIILSLNESTTLLEAMLISVSCILSLAILVPVLFALRKRIEITRFRTETRKKKSLIMLSLAVIIISLAAWNISWLNPEVLP